MSWTRKTPAELIGLTFISVVLVTAFIFIFLAILEISGASMIIERKIPKSFWLIHETDYYGEKLISDPYSNIGTKYLHPYYLFSLPWMADDIDNINNNYVSINQEGFRNAKAQEKDKTALLLGGSTAFGHFSSSDETTLASQLSIKTEYNFINRNAPSWNSHQELIALTKYPGTYSLDISFSLANDLALFCYIKDYNLPFIDKVESFDTLSSYFSDLGVKNMIKRNLQTFSIKNVTNRLFPESFALLGTLKRFLKQPNSDHLTDAPTEHPCFEHTDLFVRTFLANQKSMRELSSVRGAVHILAIQPMYPLHENMINKNWYRSILFRDNRASQKEKLFINNIIKRIMADSFCDQNCLDLSTVFQNVPSENILFDSFDENSIEKAVFVDSVHLTDNGVLIIADKLAKFIEQL